MPKLTDTQLIILSAACAREDRKVLPLPKSLKGGAATKVIDALIAKGLVTEIDALKGEPVWREDGEGRRLTLVATAAAEAVLEGGNARSNADTPTAPPRPGKAATAREAAKGTKVASRPAKPAEAAPVPAQARMREGTKQAQLIAMLTRAKGASIAEIAEALGWQAHTVRGALAGALKKKLGLDIASEPHETRGTGLPHHGLNHALKRPAPRRRWPSAGGVAASGRETSRAGGWWLHCRPRATQEFAEASAQQRQQLFRLRSLSSDIRRYSESFLKDPRCFRAFCAVT